MLKKLINFAIILSLFSIYSCANDSENDLLLPVEEIDLTTYNEHIKTIIDNNCIFCHSDPPVNGAPMPLITYGNVKDAIENRNLINRISSDDLGFSMPLGGPKLPQNLIDLVTQWETDGLIEE